MIVTINTDASFSQTHKRGSYAFSIVSDGGRLKRAGMLKKQIGRPEAAEFMAVINAIYQLGEIKIPMIDKIIGLNVIHLVTGNQKAIDRYGLSVWGQDLLKQYRRVVTNARLNGVPIFFRHVKAHTGDDNKRSWANHFLDDQARQILMKELKLQEDEC